MDKVYKPIAEAGFNPSVSMDSSGSVRDESGECLSCSGVSILLCQWIPLEVLFAHFVHQ